MVMKCDRVGFGGWEVGNTNPHNSRFSRLVLHKLVLRLTTNTHRQLLMQVAMGIPQARHVLRACAKSCDPKTLSSSTDQNVKVMLETCNPEIILLCLSEMAHGYFGQNCKDRTALVILSKALCAAHKLLEEPDLSGRECQFYEGLVHAGQMQMMHAPKGGVLTQLRQHVQASAACDLVRVAVEPTSAKCVYLRVNDIHTNTAIGALTFLCPPPTVYLPKNKRKRLVKARLPQAS